MGYILQIIAAFIMAAEIIGYQRIMAYQTSLAPLKDLQLTYDMFFRTFARMQKNRHKKILADVVLPIIVGFSSFYQIKMWTNEDGLFHLDGNILVGGIIAFYIPFRNVIV